MGGTEEGRQSEAEKETGNLKLAYKPFKIDTWCGTALNPVWIQPHNKPVCVYLCICGRACLWKYLLFVRLWFFACVLVYQCMFDFSSFCVWISISLSLPLCCLCPFCGLGLIEWMEIITRCSASLPALATSTSISSSPFLLFLSYKPSFRSSFSNQSYPKEPQNQSTISEQAVCLSHIFLRLFFSWLFDCSSVWYTSFGCLTFQLHLDTNSLNYARLFHTTTFQ